MWYFHTDKLSNGKLFVVVIKKENVKNYKIEIIMIYVAGDIV